MNYKNLILGVFLPIVLVVAGIGLFVTLQVPEPQQTRLANPTNEGELLDYLPAAEYREVRLLTEPLNIEASGTVVPFRELQIAAEVAGRIVQKDPSVRSGNYVKKGQLLYTIDPRDYELEIERLTRRKAQEEASIIELDQEIKNAQKLLDVAEEQVKLAEADVRRLQNMNKDFSSAAELDEARRARLTALNQEVTIRNQLSASETRRSRLELAARLAETELAQANLNMSRTEIRSPVEGRVVSEQVEADSYVQRGTQLLVIEDTEKVEVACNVRMDQLSWILEQPNASADQLVNAAQGGRYELPQTPVEVSFNIAGRDSTTFRWQGRLDRFDGAGLDPQSRTVPIRILVEDPSEYAVARTEGGTASHGPMLVRGMFVDVIIKATPTTQLMLVPELGIKPATNSSVIWKFSENREVVRNSPSAKEAIEAYAQAEEEGRIEEIYGAKADGDKATPDPDGWDAGNLTIVDDVRMVAEYWQDEDYWVCEVPFDELSAGDRVIVSPLPGVKADGTDAIRVPKPPMQEEAAESLAGKEQENGQS